MPLPAILLTALVLVQASDTVPMEGLGFQILWMPKSLAETSNTSPGFKFSHPSTREPLCFSKGKDLNPVLGKLSPQMKANGIWITTSNAFLYSDPENLELKTVVDLARARKIPVFLCEIGQQPEGWKRIDH